MTDFRCHCTGCGRKPEFGASGIWFQSESGMLCESCWGVMLRKSAPSQESAGVATGEFCCFCALCKRTPPDPVYKIWIETEKGCICEKCWKETVSVLLAERIESTLIDVVPRKSEPLDVQLGCCLLNKKLLIKALDALGEGEELEIIAENTDVMKEMIDKYVGSKGCVITGITAKNGTCLITISRK